MDPLPLHVKHIHCYVMPSKNNTLVQLYAHMSSNSDILPDVMFTSIFLACLFPINVGCK